MKRSLFPHRLGAVTLIEVFVVIGVIVTLVDLLLPSVLRVREAAARAKSQCHLKQICLAINNYAAANKNTLPNAADHAPYFFCGVTAGKPSSASRFSGGILSMMEGNTKSLGAPLDVNLPSAPSFACSYSIPAHWATLNGGTGDLKFPKSFPRGTSLCIASAEMTTFGVTYMDIRPFTDAPYTPAVLNTPSITANNFTISGCQVGMLDGSVRNVNQAANTALDWTAACHPDDEATFFSSNW